MRRRQRGLVSIVVTSWNRKRYIRQCLQGIAAQTYKDIEVIIVDDGSTDGTQSLIRQWAKQLGHRFQNRVIFAPMPRNMGYSGALTTAMFMARGEFIATHDSDDFSHPDRIRRQVNFMRSHPKIGLVGCNYRIVRHGKVLKLNPGWLSYGPEKVRETYQRGGHCITCGSLLFRAKLFDRLGGLNRSIEGAEDYEFVARLNKMGVRMDNLRDVLYYVRQHDQQISIKYYGRHA